MASNSLSNNKTPGIGQVISDDTNSIDREKRHKTRTKLPAPMRRVEISGWSIIKNSLGKDLSRISMPVALNEPLTFLQKLVEYIEYAGLLHAAAAASDPLDRLALIAAFAVAGNSSNCGRVTKPFNPLLSETYEFESPALGVRVVCEQVSHHPPMSAFHCESALEQLPFSLDGHVNPRSLLLGRVLVAQPRGVMTLSLHTHNEVFTWQQVPCVIHNVIFGKGLWMEHNGQIEITNHRTNYRAVIRFRAAGSDLHDLHKVDGYILDEKKRKVFALYGKWNDVLYRVPLSSWEQQLQSVSSTNSSQAHTSAPTGGSLNRVSSANGTSLKVTPPNAARASAPTLERAIETMSVEDDDNESGPLSVADLGLSDEALAALGNGTEADAGALLEGVQPLAGCYSLGLAGEQLLWKAAQRPPDSQLYYNFTRFSLALNEFDERIVARLPLTDSRFRPDVRILEQADHESAEIEKQRLEEKQRSARKRQGKTKSMSMWFEPTTNSYTGKPDWMWNALYWNRDFSKCPDLF